MRKITILAVFLLLFSFCAYAYDLEPYLTYTTGNAGIDRLGSFSNTFLAAPYQSYQNLTDGNISICYMPTSTYTILTDDFNGDYYPDFLITTATELRVYSKSCTLLSSKSFSTLTAPFLVDYNNNLKNEIVVSNSTDLVFIEYNRTTNALDVVKTVYTTIDKTDMMCNRYKGAEDEKFCIVEKDGEYYVRKFSFGAFDNDFTNITPTITQISLDVSSAIVVKDGDTGFKTSQISIQIAELGKNYIIIPYYNTGSAESGLLLFNSSFSQIFKKNLYDKAGYSNTINYISYIGGRYIIFTDALSYYANVIDTSGTTLKANINTLCDDQPLMSAPFYKVSAQKFLACRKQDSGASNYKNFLRVFSADFGSYTDYGINNNTDNHAWCVMSDFNTSRNTLGLACSDGTFGMYPKIGSEDAQVMYNTKISSGVAEYPITVSQDFVNYKPYVAFSNETTSFLIQWTGTGDTCGDLNCTESENQYTCPMDCNTSGTGTGSTVVVGDLCCTKDSECASTIYNKCYAGSCVKGYTETTCLSSYSCPLTAPLCIGLNSQGYGHCVNAIGTGEVCNSSSVFVGTPTSDATDPNASTGNTQDDIYRTWQILFGASAWLRYFVGLVILIGVLWGVAHSMNNPIIIGIIGIAVMLFLTMIGLLPIWLAIIVVILVFFLFYSSIGRTQGG
jgi:hypothetical protein